MLLCSNTSLHHVYVSDLQQCQKKDTVYTCPLELLDWPEDNFCFCAHRANSIEAIQKACDLKKSQDMNSIIELQDGILYYDLPEESKVMRHCATITQLPLEGNGLVTLPPGCSLQYKMKSFTN